MYYSVPPSYQRALSAAHIIGTINTGVLAAPGVGFAYRILGGVIGVTRTTTGIVDELLIDAVSGLVIWIAGSLSVGGMSSIPILVPPPGIQLTPNSALTLQSASTAATGATQIVIYYTTDDVS